jgi:hypothetical protein
MRNVSDEIVEKIKTHILCSITSFRKPCRWWDNLEKYGRDRQATNDNMGFACWISKATNTHLEYCFSTPTMVTRMHLNVMLYIRSLSCYSVSRSEWSKNFSVMRQLDTLSEVHGPRTIILLSVCLRLPINRIAPRWYLCNPFGHAFYCFDTTNVVTSLKAGSQHHRFKR